jgi:hypothetical protein
MTIRINRLSFSIIVSLISFTYCLPGHSQDVGAAKATPPPRLYVGTLRGDYTFIKKIVYKPKPPASKPTGSAAEVPPAPSAPDLAELDSVQTGTLRKDKQIFVDGTSSEIWRSGALRFITQSANPDALIVASQMLSYYVDPADFEELKWVGPGFFQGEQAIDDKKYYVYKQGTQTALIDESTHLPLLFDSELMHVTYTYGVPDAPLQLPANCAKKLQQMKRSWAGLPN